MLSKQNGFVDPMKLFSEWLHEAEKKELNDPNAAALSTADESGYPNVRVVLIKKANINGFIFFTNLNSQKSMEIQKNKRAALCFHWKSLERQVRVRGKVEAVPPDEADEYFASRPYLSKIGSWASKQSQPLQSNLDLEKNIAYYTAKYVTKKIPRPEHWSGFRIIPEEIEFWQAGEYRLHKRILFRRDEETWNRSFLYP